MCPNCSKFCCGRCIKKWITEQKPSCPHCRAKLEIDQLVNCRFISDIQNVMTRLNEEVRPDSPEKAENCEEHGTKISYYCKDCSVPICSDCAMFGTKHKNHEFEKINTIYL